MKFYLLVLALLFSVSSNAQFKNIILEHNGATSQYQHLDSALAHAVNGDDLYLSGGNFPFSGLLTKGVNIYGAGFYPDSTLATLPTILTGFVTLQISGVNANNLMLTGVLVGTPGSVGTIQIVNGASNILITRCQFWGFGVTTSPNSSNLTLAECVIGNGGISASGVTNFSIRSSIIHGTLSLINAGVFENNIFMSMSGLFPNIQNSVFRNNIVYLPSATNHGGGTNSYYNNVFTSAVNSVPTGSIFQNNLQNHPLSVIFENVIPSTSFQYSSNYRLKTSSPAIAVGIGGTDAGIYGGTNPAKDGFVPLNPHIQKFSVPANTDANGTLRINVSVRAQNN